MGLGVSKIRCDGISIQCRKQNISAEGGTPCLPADAVSQAGNPHGRHGNKWKFFKSSFNFLRM